VAGHVAGDLAAAHGEAGDGHVLKRQGVDDGGQVVGHGVVVVAVPGLLGPSEAAPVIGDHAMPRAGEVERLVLPGIGVERPAVDQHDRAARPPVLDVERGAVGGVDAGHGGPSLFDGRQGS
jgi:hypothetical protein